MRLNSIITLLLLLTYILPSQLHATEWTTENLPMVHLQDARRYVCDPEGILSPSVRDSIDALLYDLETEKGVQTVVAVIGKIKGGDCYDFGMNIGRQYGIGSKKQNTGLIVILSTQDRCYQILTGHGLEGSLPDAICRRIENRYMVPFLKRGNWDQAMLQGMTAISHYLKRDSSLFSEGIPGIRRSQSEDQLYALFIIGIISLVLFLGFWSRRQRNKCPRCGKHQLTPTTSSLLKKQHNPGKKYVIYVCRHCGYTLTREENDNDHFHSGGGSILPPFIFFGGNPGRGGGFGEGPFGGGSFGGGSFGGGGSGGKF